MSTKGFLHSRANTSLGLETNTYLDDSQIGPSKLRIAYLHGSVSRLTQVL